MSIRTQIYLTEEQRARLDERARHEGITLARLIRRAVDELLEGEDDLDATFGAAPGIEATVPPRDGWSHRLG